MANALQKILNKLEEVNAGAVQVESDVHGNDKNGGNDLYNEEVQRITNES